MFSANIAPCFMPLTHIFIPITIHARKSSTYTLVFSEQTRVNPTGIAVAASAYAGRYGILAWNAFKARPATPVLRKFYQGGFQPQMTRREAALILGVRESAAQDKVREAYRKVMVANHPDAGGSHYLASKIGEAKDMMLKKTRNTDSAF